MYLRFSETSYPMMPKTTKKWSCSLIVLLLFTWVAPFAEAQKAAGEMAGMWSDPPHTAVGEFCFAWRTDAGLEHLNKLLDDPANDARAFGELSAEASR